MFRPGDPGLIVFALVALPVYFSMVHRLLGMQLAAAPDAAAAELFTQVVLMVCACTPMISIRASLRVTAAEPCAAASGQPQGRVPAAAEPSSKEVKK